ncbi:Pyridine nucleotide-disulfide oxidoreductase, FAD/NAD(P)-binding domain protein [Akanthomyces lecanii RCEF 1005]|uniref:Pyridine nucleotide-disulfide oxidoreductase, FAD/NAD(P)-binding domain protein n=1 Tax=Akanthomyces lecanii RCEF 1005 TaxID=1081108 RepID=A0A162KM84_CORDF|nr:Pyridine nucleotide-disulfide oxidoreductase, FAD/NAD(P)-binding domain protein [Akanthomyces lecanii RCEF 1005]
MTGKTIVVLGGSIGGLGVAHRLLKHTLPNQPDLKVILVSQNSHFYWNVAAVRAIIPNILQDEELLQPIGPGLEQYNTAEHPAAAEFIVGTATSIDTAARSVQVELTTATATTRTVAYDHLVIATGSRSVVPGMPWKAGDSHADAVASIHDTAARVQAAAHIAVVGAGATGVEVCGEIRYEFPDKQVVLLSGSDALVGGDATAPAMEKALTSMGVVVRKGVRAQGTKQLADGRTQVELSNGETMVTDLYLPTVGLAPNSEFVPGELLDDKKLVKADEYMRVTGVENVWAAGDVVGKPSAGYLMTEAQARNLRGQKYR